MKKTSFVFVIVIIILSLTAFSACQENLVGKSAYEIAVEHGFEGTVEEWLDSLKGSNGLDTNYLSVSYAANKGLLSSVLITCKFTKGTTVNTSAGSGVIMSEDKSTGSAYIATNYHVVYDSAVNGISEDIKVFLYGQELEKYAITAQYVGGSLTYDVAVLKITNSEIYKTSAAQAVELSSSFTHYAGDTAIAIGNPQGYGFSVTAGIIGVDSEQIEMKGADGVTTVRFRVLRVDTAVNSGNSGGGLFNSAGQLIGMVNAKIISNNVENIGYAIPLSIVVGVYNNILNNCDGVDNVKVKRCLLGITIAPKESYAFYNTESLKVEVREDVEVLSVEETGAAYGIIQVGDILKSITYKGQVVEITRNFTVVDYSLRFEHNTTLTLTVLRNGELTSIDVLLANVVEVL